MIESVGSVHFQIFIVAASNLAELGRLPDKLPACPRQYLCYVLESIMMLANDLSQGYHNDVFLIVISIIYIMVISIIYLMVISMIYLMVISMI